MKNYILIIILSIAVLPAWAQYSVQGGSGTPYLAKDDTYNRIQVYLLNGLSNAKISYTSSDAGAHQWYKYKNNALEQDPVVSTQVGNTSSITDISDGYGYYVGEPGISTKYIWIIDYSLHKPDLHSIQADPSGDNCELLKLLIDITADELFYNIPTNGKKEDVIREYSLLYQTMVWSEEKTMYIPKDMDETIKGTVLEHNVNSPLMNTVFELTGDQFAQHFGIQQTKKSEEFEAVAVEAHIIAKTDKEITSTTTNAISAPVQYTYTAYTNESADKFNWKIFNSNKSKEEPVAYANTSTFDYEFLYPGNYEIKLEVSNKTCSYETQADNITISDFSLFIPNAFSPNGTPGINDIFKVTYKSIAKFDARIFNRWGIELFHWNDPDSGWDGKYQGKPVPPGAYFYIIDATSAAGENVIRKGDINIFGGK